ncbi:multiple epidermal growth factor-like domains protein 11 [Haliotis rubra]|uniref:multiple epidermal growth factor-like domains protein 11 n=1 Tax=Haliotis rubra TaxID=36100 RepID=UPI001EE53340|nr:multiple epidermal growth factor-like domains protein 11 [Haliotis rubra]
MAGVRILVVLVCVGRIQLASGFCASGKFGDSCSYSCHCPIPCNETTGACSGDCDTGWRKAGGLCQKQNIALNKGASTTSGVYLDWYAAKAVDGNSDMNGGSSTCFHAAGSPSDWTVDLGQDLQLYDIRIYSRNGYYWRNANSNIYLNNDTSSICSTLPSPPCTPNPTDVTCICTGRYVTIRNSGTGGRDGYASALNICEVEIYACSPGIYGLKCNTFCHCLNSTCDRLTGLCPGDCRPGFAGRTM